MTRLDLGCGGSVKPGFIGIDLHPQADVQIDLRERLGYADGSVDEIYAKHLIEHFSEMEWQKIIKDWSRVLKQGGRLTVECPDVSRVFIRWLNNAEGRRDYWTHCIYGQHWIEHMAHKNGFHLEKITQDFNGNGLAIEYVEWLCDDTPDPNGFNIKVEAIKC